MATGHRPRGELSSLSDQDCEMIQVRRGHLLMQLTQAPDSFNSLAKTLSAKSANHNLKVIRMLFKAAQRDELLIQNPAEFVNTLRQRSTSDKRPFTLAEIQAVLSVADPEWQSLIRFGFYTGQRLGDLAVLRWSNIDLAKDEIRFVTAKTGRRMIIPLSEGLRAHIASFLQRQS
jgi:integrase